MATNRIEATKFSEEVDQASPDALPKNGPRETRSGLKAWLPLIANVVLMPALAYLMTTFVLLPKVRSNAQVAPNTAKGGGQSGGSSQSPGGKQSFAKNEVTVPLNGKVLVNVSGTMGARYLLANITLVGTNPDLKLTVEKNDAQLRDVAASVLANKTIADLDKPGARNLVRTELVSAFNNVLGKGIVTGIFFTEFAIQ